MRVAGGSSVPGGTCRFSHSPFPTATDGKWGPWNAWSLCSKTCDTGWQRRFRMCQATGSQGYPCEGTGEEVKPCSEKKCPGTTACIALGSWGHVCEPG